jgi:hypothetical protein
VAALADPWPWPLSLAAVEQLWAVREGSHVTEKQMAALFREADTPTPRLSATT